jgi:hypothetical protein
MLAFSVLWMLIFSAHTHVFYSAPRLADDDALLLSISFTHPTPILSFCHILVSQSQNLVSEYRSSFAVQSSASNGLLNSQSRSE